jgi:anti-sigma28 factor (negative regulator of flagellin synthesis)
VWLGADQNESHLTLDDRSTKPFKGELKMNPMNPGVPLTDADRERLYIIKRAIAAGTYHISADDVATKLILSMLESVDVPSFSETTGSSETRMEELLPEQKRG